MWWPWVSNRRLLGELQAISTVLQFVTHNQRTTHGMLWSIDRQLEGMMAKAADAKKAIAAEFEAVRADLAKVAVGVKAMNDAIAALRSQQANGGAVDDKDWDAIIDGGKAVQDAADALAAAFPTEPPAAAEGSDGGMNPATDATQVPGGRTIDGKNSQ